MDEHKNAAQRTLERAHRRPTAGVEYKLRVIPGSNGMLEIVEQRPKPSPFNEWARAMQLSGWSF